MSNLQRIEETNSTIGKNSRFEGKFAIKGSIKIDGRFEGDVLIVDKVIIGPKGKV